MTARVRWMRFNAVGAVGFLVQTSLLAALIRWTSLTTTAAVATAVAVAIAHNAVWHERVTWRQLPPSGRRRRWLAFSAWSGAISAMTNVVATAPLAAVTGLPVVVANMVVVLAASLLNFLVADRAIFSR